MTTSPLTSLSFNAAKSLAVPAGTYLCHISSIETAPGKANPNAMNIKLTLELMNNNLVHVGTVSTYLGDLNAYATNPQKTQTIMRSWVQVQEAFNLPIAGDEPINVDSFAAYLSAAMARNEVGVVAVTVTTSAQWGTQNNVISYGKLPSARADTV